VISLELLSLYYLFQYLVALLDVNMAFSIFVLTTYNEPFTSLLPLISSYVSLGDIPFCLDTID
jgi:hypothetical protein